MAPADATHGGRSAVFALNLLNRSVRLGLAWRNGSAVASALDAWREERVSLAAGARLDALANAVWLV